MAKYLNPVDFASGDALVRGLFGKNAKGYLLELQNKLVSWELHITSPELATPIDVFVGGYKMRDYEGPKEDLARRMPFATTMRLVDTAQRGADIDFRKEAELLMAELKGRFAIPAKTGHYADSFRYVIGSTAYLTIPPINFTIIGITNIANYSSTMENPTWHRPFNKCWVGYARRRAAKMGYEARWRYLGGSSRGYMHKGIRPDPNRKQSYPRWINYAVPVIEIGPIGSMTRTGKWRARHGRNRRRMR